MTDELGGTEKINHIVIDMLIDDCYEKTYKYKETELTIKLKKKDGKPQET